MENEISSLEIFREKYEEQLMALPEVIGTGIGVCQDSKPCLKIYSSVPEEEFQRCLPPILEGVRIEIEYIGDVSAE